jgi:fumarate reductase subunit C
MATRVFAPRAEILLWFAQRASAAVLALGLVVHLATIIYAVRGGLSAAEILGRTQGSVMWLVFYSLFVAAVAVHASIGVRTILRESVAVRGVWIDLAAAVFALLLMVMGARAISGLFG